MRCTGCAEGHLEYRTGTGRRWRFKNIPDLEIPSDVPVLTCNTCGATSLDRETAQRLDAVLVPAYEAELRRKAVQALAVLSEAGVTQRDLEPLLGLSGGYLSKLRNGKEPSGPLVSLLMLLATNPQAVSQLKRLWSVESDLRAERERSVLTLSWRQHVIATAAPSPFVRPPDKSEPAIHRTLHLRPAA
jgi:transcriptional regulator with XRE-family HTH domain